MLIHEIPIKIHFIHIFLNLLNKTIPIVKPSIGNINFTNNLTITNIKIKNVKIAYGGKERQDSVYNGLKLLDEKCDVVLIHDGARPFVSDKIIDKSIEEAKEHKAIVVGVPVKDTIKVIDNDKNIVDTPNRSVLWAVQTPQTFDYNILIDAYKDAFKNKFYGTDDAMLVERIGYKVKMLEGSYNNIKITTQEDLNIGSQILRVQD